MARVILPRPLAEMTGGELEFEIEAGNVRALIRELDRLFPGMGDLLSGQVTVAIDGEIMSDPLLEPLVAENEVHFLPRVGGGAPRLEDR
ncbi:MAG: MoaD/ThiS family protein [Myxococcota bacterium]|nr:MoaD/ThiS family protein [Myxococcota bacterium]